MTKRDTLLAQADRKLLAGREYRGASRIDGPLVYMMSRRSSLTRRIYPSLTVGEMAKPLWLMILLPFVVSMQRMASISSLISALLTVSMSTVPPMIQWLQYLHLFLESHQR